MSKISELDAQTGILELRDPTSEEIDSFAVAEFADFETLVAAKAAARESRRQKLIALGLTEDELDA